MSSVIDFLERMGSDAQWRHASQEDLDLALAETDITAPERTAILAKDALALKALLRQVPLFAMQIPGAPDEEGDEDEGEEDGDDEKHEPNGRYCSSIASLHQYA